MNTTLSATEYGMIRRIRVPHPHDVLSGRGGGINSHAGNIQFREWVRVRKNDYNLAPSKVEKSKVAKQVVALVRTLDPPGRFLQKDPSAVGNWWIEIDEDRVIAKTSQALREGAPQIRAAHQQEINEIRAKVPSLSRKSHEKRKVPPKRVIPNKAVFSSVSRPLKRPHEHGATGWPVPVQISSSTADEEAAYQEKALMELRANVEQARLRNNLLENDPVIRAEKRMRQMNEEENEASPELPPPMPSSTVPRLSFANEQRSNSLALSDFSYEPGMEEFVNPFEDDLEGILNEPPKGFGFPPTTWGVDIESPNFNAAPAMPAPLSRSKSARSLSTQGEDPLVTFLKSLDRGVTTQ